MADLRAEPFLDKARMELLADKILYSGDEAEAARAELLRAIASADALGDPFAAQAAAAVAAKEAVSAKLTADLSKAEAAYAWTVAAHCEAKATYESARATFVTCLSTAKMAILSSYRAAGVYRQGVARADAKRAVEALIKAEAAIRPAKATLAAAESALIPAKASLDTARNSYSETRTESATFRSTTLRRVLRFFLRSRR